MKKNLFLTMLAVAAVLVGCEKTDNGSGTGTSGNRFEFRESVVTLTPGSEVRLALVDDSKANDYVWTSSDTTVAQVSTAGVVTGVDYGEADITVVSGTREATCRVVVKNYMETLTFPLALIYDLDTETLKSLPDTTVVRGNDEYHCVWAIAEIRLCSEGFYVDNDLEMTGADEVVMMTVYSPVLYDSVNRIQFVLGDYEILPAADYKVEQNIAPGGIDEDAYKYYSEIAAKDYVAYEYYGDTTVSNRLVMAWKYMGTCLYAPMKYLFYEVGETEEETGYYSYAYPFGYANSGVFALDANESLDYMCTVSYADIKASYWDDATFFGWYPTNEELPENPEDLVWEYVGATDVTYAHGTLPTGGVKELKEVRLPVIKRDYPQMAAQMEKTMSMCKKMVRK